MSAPPAPEPTPNIGLPEVSGRIRQLAQQDPTSNRLRAFGENVKTMRAMLDDATRLARQLDEEAESLRQQGITITLDFGAVGNAFFAARRDLDQPHTFERGRRQ